MPDPFVADPELVPRPGRAAGAKLPAMPRWVWISAAAMIVAGAAGVGVLYVLLPAGTASFLAIAGLIVCISGAGPVVLGAYTRHREMRSRRARDEVAEIIVPPTSSGDQASRS
jgi:ABC-type phosphate transport system auxiliary subunit